MSDFLNHLNGMFHSDHGLKTKIKLKDETANENVRTVTRPEDSSRGSVMNTNKETLSDTMEQLHGSSSTSEKSASIEIDADNALHDCHFLDHYMVDRMYTWLNNVPDGCGISDLGYTCDIGMEVLKEWMNWSKYTAFAWIQKLDEFERRFRLAALEYHKVPNSLRHSSTLLHSSKIDQGTLTCLEQILETDPPRDQQSFFMTWLQINNTATKIVNEVDLSYPLPDDAAVLSATLERFKANFGRLEKPLHIIEMGLDWLEAAVALVASRCPSRGTEQLEERHSREGILFRQWIQTLPEIQKGMVKSSQYTEFYVEQLLEVGVEREAYWSMLVKGKGS